MPRAAPPLTIIAIITISTIITIIIIIICQVESAGNADKLPCGDHGAVLWFLATCYVTPACGCFFQATPYSVRHDSTSDGSRQHAARGVSTTDIDIAQAVAWGVSTTGSRVGRVQQYQGVSLQALLSFVGDLPQGGRAHTSAGLPPPLWPEEDVPERACDPANPLRCRACQLPARP